MGHCSPLSIQRQSHIAEPVACLDQSRIVGGPDGDRFELAHVHHQGSVLSTKAVGNVRVL
jgi:hypothetical protein